MEILCPICRKEDRLIFKDSALNMYRCTECDHAFSLIDQNRRVEYKEEYYNSSHANWFNNPNYWLFRFIHSNVIRLIKKDRIRLLDVGCGKGAFLKYIQKKDRNMELYGVDLCDNNFSGIHFTKMDFLKEEYPMRVDVVSGLTVIEHLDNVDAFFKKLQKILLPDGLVVLTTENTGSLFYTVARILKKLGITTPFYSLYEPAHLQHFTNHSLRALAEHYGFKLILQKNHNYPIKAVNFPPANMLTRALYLMGVGIFFSLPKRFGILQTVICKKVL